jgi:hypothetical protein
LRSSASSVTRTSAPRPQPARHNPLPTITTAGSAAIANSGGSNRTTAGGHHVAQPHLRGGDARLPLRQDLRQGRHAEISVAFGVLRESLPAGQPKKRR